MNSKDFIASRLSSKFIRQMNEQVAPLIQATTAEVLDGHVAECSHRALLAGAF